MCDWKPGELLLTFSNDDDAAIFLLDRLRGRPIGQIRYAESLSDKLGRMHLSIDRSLGFQFHRVFVPVGQETWHVTELQHLYQQKVLDILEHPPVPRGFSSLLRKPECQFNVAPNHVMSLTAASTLAQIPVRAADFTFSPWHAQYRASMNAALVPAPSPPHPVRVLVIDSGIASDASFVQKQANFADPNDPLATDEHGHGTAVASIIHNLMPQAQILVAKVTDASHYASEWDVLAALATKHDAHLINLSLAFGLEDPQCGNCGRQSETSRSRVFETLLLQSPRRAIEPIIVAATGNTRQSAATSHRTTLAYPARFGHVLAIGSVTSQMKLSSFSRYGDRDAHDDQHRNRFVVPGGESTGPTPEEVGRFGLQGTPVYGTSFAAAYASGLVANVMAKQGGAPSGVIATLKQHVDDKFLGYDPLRHGHGLMRL